MSYKIETIRVSQNNQGFLLGIFRMSELRKFVKFTHRIVIEFDEESKPKYNEEVQRKISASKVDSIADFLIHDEDSFFPTNIVLSVPQAAIETLEVLDNKAVIELKDKVIQENSKEDGEVYITIIDGQHRVAGIERAIKRLNEEIVALQRTIEKSSDPYKFQIQLNKKSTLLNRLLNFEIIATFFIDPLLEYQAMIFSTINRTQTKVSEDLVFSLFGLSKEDSPQKTSLEIVLALNASEKSPFYNRIKLAGAKYVNGTLPPLSQSAMVKSILYLITPNLKQAEIEKNKPRQYVFEKRFNNYLPFRKYYGDDEDEKILKILNAYFWAVNETFVDSTGVPYWSVSAKVNILQTTVGYHALLQILVELLKLTNEANRFDILYYKEKLSLAVGIDFQDEGERKHFPFTSKSINVLYNEIGVRIFGTSFALREIKQD